MHEFKPAARAALRVAALTLALSACTVGPDYVRPTLPTPERFARDETNDAASAPAAPATTANADVAESAASAVATDAATSAASPADAEFWRGFDDPLLTRLVDEALTANHDLRIALSRYDRANALLRDAKFDYAARRHRQRAPPASLAQQRRPGAGRVARGSRRRELRRVGIVAGWELDLFGRIRRNVESQRADAAAERCGPGGAAGRDRRRGRAQLRRAARPAGAPARGARQRRQPARDAAPGPGAARCRPRHRVRHLARTRAAGDDAGARAGAGSAGRGRPCIASRCSPDARRTR